MGHDSFDVAAADAVELAAYKEAEAKKAESESLTSQTRAGEIEPDEASKQAVEAASQEFWTAFDQYVLAVRSGDTAAVAPSRNQHRFKFLNVGFNEKELAPEVKGVREGYWERLFDSEKEKRKIPKGENIGEAKIIFDRLLYERIIPPEVQIEE